ncbi:MAG: 4-hydroxy-tetrahydrodipicolinate synthase [Burkholderiaceae bacterium]
MSTSPHFSGLWIPLVTPFRDGKVDHPAVTQLVKRLCADGIAGMVVCGSTGEAAALDASEQLALLENVLQAAAGRPVLMGVSGYHLGQTQQWIQRLNKKSLVGLLLSAPHYIRPSQRGLADWFTALAETSAKPIVVYDIPYRTGATITRETLQHLAEHPNIRAVKDCGGDAGKTLALIAQGRLQVLAGEDLQIFSTVAQGGSGAIAASAHLATPRFVRLLELLSAGRLAEARAVWLLLLPWIEAAFAEPNPGPVKAVLAARGAMRPELRAPMTAPGAALVARMCTLLRRIEEAEPALSLP